MRWFLAVAMALSLTACAGRSLPRDAGPDPADLQARSSPPLAAEGSVAPDAHHATASARGGDAPPPITDSRPVPNDPTAPRTAPALPHDDSDGSGRAMLGPKAAPVLTDAVFQRYFTLSEALVIDDFAAATEALVPLRTAADEVAHSSYVMVGEAAARVRDAIPRDPKQIAELRGAFKQVSEAATSLLRVAPPTEAVGPVVRRVHCPIAEAFWLQTEAEIRNPYMGRQMQHCGRIVEEFPTRAVTQAK